MSNKVTQMEEMQKAKIGDQLQEIVDISIDKIPNLEISDFTTDEIEALAQELQQTMKIEPLTVVYVQEKGNYEILYGEKLYHAVREVNEKNDQLFATVPCWIKKQKAETVDDIAVTDDDIQKVLDQITNDGKEKDGYRLRVYTHIIRLCGDTYKHRHMRARTAKIFGITERYAGMYERIARLGTDDLKDAVAKEEKKGHIAVSIAAKIINLPKDTQSRIIERVKKGENASAAYRAETREDPLIKNAKITKSWINDILTRYDRNLAKDQKKTMMDMQTIIDNICKNGLKAIMKSADGNAPDDASSSSNNQTEECIENNDGE